MLDMVIENALVVDGSGGTPYRADIGVAFRTGACFRDPERYPESLEAVLVNGVPVVANGEPVPGAVPGEVLRKNR